MTDITKLNARIQFFDLESLEQALMDAKEGSFLQKELRTLLYSVKTLREQDENL